MEKRKPEFLPRAQVKLRSRENDGGFLGMERCAPARFFRQAIPALAFQFGRDGDAILLL